MAITQNDIDMVMELFEPIGDIRVRKMMGGLSIYSADVTFAILTPEGVIYLKVDDHNRADFEAEGQEIFTMTSKDGKVGTMGYYTMPERCYDDPQQLEIWGRKALDVALRSKAKKKPKKTKI